MALATFSVRMDEKLKKQFDALCNDFGMTASTVFNVFVKTVVREHKPPNVMVSAMLSSHEMTRQHKAFSPKAVHCYNESNVEYYRINEKRIVN